MLNPLNIHVANRFQKRTAVSLKLGDAGLHGFAGVADHLVSVGFADYNSTGKLTGNGLKRRELATRLVKGFADCIGNDQGSHNILQKQNLTPVQDKPQTQNDSLLQRQQKAFGSRLAVEVTMNATLGRRTGIHGVTETCAVRLKDVKVMNDGFHGDLLVVDDQARNVSKTGIATDAIAGRLKPPASNLVAVHVGGGHSKRNLFASTVRQHTETGVTCIGIDLFKTEVSRKLAHLSDKNATVGKPIKVFRTNGSHNILQTRNNLLGSISQKHRMMEFKR